MFIYLSSLMTSNQSLKFNKILKHNKDACEYSINQRHHCKPNNFFFFFFSIFWFFFFKWKQMVSKLLNKKQHKIHHAIKQTINTPPQLKVDIVLNVQTNVCENQRQVLKWKNKEKWKKTPNMMTNSSSYFLQNG